MNVMMSVSLFFCLWSHGQDIQNTKKNLKKKGQYKIMSKFLAQMPSAQQWLRYNDTEDNDKVKT